VPIAPSTYHAHKAQPVSDADWADAHMANTVLDVWRANRSVYGADKLAVAMRNAGYDVGRDQVARLMRIVGIQGVTRGTHRTVRTDLLNGRLRQTLDWLTPYEKLNDLILATTP